MPLKLYRYIFLVDIISFCGPTTVHAQKWLPGHFTDNKGNVETGMIWMRPAGKGPISDEAFIEFRDNDKTQPYKLSASDLKSFVISRDSFVVAAEPQTESWQYAVDFVKVVLDEDVKLYLFRGGAGESYGGIQPGVEGGVGGGTGGYGGGVGVGLSIPIGHGGGSSNKIIYYYGENTAQMKVLTNANFIDIMSDMMGDEPDVSLDIKEKKYDLAHIDKLIAYFRKVQASHTTGAKGSAQ